MATKLTQKEEILRNYLIEIKNGTGLSLKQLSEILGISYGMLRHYSAGTKAISMDTFKNLTGAAVKLNVCRDEYLEEIFFNTSATGQVYNAINVGMKSQKRAAVLGLGRAMRDATNAGFDADEILQYCKHRLARYQESIQPYSMLPAPSPN